MSKYRKIYLKMWGDRKFRNLSKPEPNGQSLWIYLLTGKMTTVIPGLINMGEAGMAETLEWSLEGFRKAFREVLSQDMVKVDWQSRLIWVPKAVEYNKPESPNVVKSWRDTWDEMPECELKNMAYQHLKAFIEGLGEAFGQAFRQSCAKPFMKALPNQEQEQEQDIPPTEGMPKASPPKESSDSAEVKQTDTSKKTKTNHRLEIFCEEYLKAKNSEYLIGNYKAEGGAAKRTQTKIPDENVFRRAVRAYLASTEPRVVENGHSFMWFIQDLNRWFQTAKRKAFDAESDEYNEIIES